ncbi:MAG TPA: serine hydrolase domain-containing protein [Chitinophagaceae bacterium]|nr:serine hydrolase domain-containing protein [Chitinophagaceae bacterium]
MMGIRATAQVDTAALSAKLNSIKNLKNNVVCLLTKDGKIIYKRESPDFSVKTPQPIGATSQWLTAALVMTYVQEGKLSLDDKVTDYIPLYAKYSKNYITIRHCLTHNTGIESDFNMNKLFQKGKFKTLEEEAIHFASKREIETNPGTEFKYSNVGFNLVGRILEVITKKGFDRIMQDRLLRPCGMRGSTFTNEDYNSATDPTSGARSTANDLTNFMTMLINKGKFNNKQILTEESINTLLTLAGEQTMKNIPVSIQGLNYVMGSWAIDQDGKGKAQSATSPSLSGTWPIVDLCRGYSLVLITSPMQNPPAKDFYLDMKSIVDQGIQCK